MAIHELTRHIEVLFHPELDTQFIVHTDASNEVRYIYCSHGIIVHTNDSDDMIGSVLRQEKMISYASSKV